MSGARGIFTNAPVTPAAPMLPTVMPGSNLAAAMSQPHSGQNLSTPSLGLPLGSLAQMVQQANSPQATYAANHQGSSLTQGPDGTWSGQPGTQPQTPPLSWAPGMPQAGAVGTPTPGSPGLPGGAGPGMGGAPGPGMPSPGQPGMFDQIAQWLKGFGQGGG